MRTAVLPVGGGASGHFGKKSPKLNGHKFG
jgi:hypothetical protein